MKTICTHVNVPDESGNDRVIPKTEKSLQVSEVEDGQVTALAGMDERGVFGKQLAIARASGLAPIFFDEASGELRFNLGPGQATYRIRLEEI